MTAEYRKELAAIKDPVTRDRLHRIAHHPSLPNGGILQAWALAMLKWRAGVRPSYPLPPSARADVDAIERVDRTVRRLIPWRSGLNAPCATPEALAA